MSDAELPVYEFGDYRVDPGNLLLSRAGRPVALTPKVFDTLLLLVKRSGESGPIPSLKKTTLTKISPPCAAYWAKPAAKIAISRPFRAEAIASFHKCEPFRKDHWRRARR
jgi:hypothetical protein